MVTSRQTVQQITYDEYQEKLYYRKEEQACLKEIMGETNDLCEEVCMDIEIEDRCTQDMGHTFMTSYSISDKDFTEIINQNLACLDTV